MTLGQDQKPTDAGKNGHIKVAFLLGKSVVTKNYGPKIVISRLPRSMPNPDQNHGIDLKCLSMPIIADQFRSIPLNADQCGSSHQ